MNAHVAHTGKRGDATAVLDKAHTVDFVIDAEHRALCDTRKDGAFR